MIKIYQKLIWLLSICEIKGSFSLTKTKTEFTWFCYPIPLLCIWNNRYSKLTSFGFSIGWLFWNATFDWTYCK